MAACHIFLVHSFNGICSVLWKEEKPRDGSSFLVFTGQEQRFLSGAAPHLAADGNEVGGEEKASACVSGLSWTCAPCLCFWRRCYWAAGCVNMAYLSVCSAGYLHSSRSPTTRGGWNYPPTPRRSHWVIRLSRKEPRTQTEVDARLIRKRDGGSDGTGSPPSRRESLRTGREVDPVSCCPSSRRQKEATCGGRRWEFKKHAASVASESGTWCEGRDELYFIHMNLPIISPVSGNMRPNERR